MGLGTFKRKCLCFSWLFSAPFVSLYITYAKLCTKTIQTLHKTLHSSDYQHVSLCIVCAQTIHKLYTNYTQNPTLRVKETKSWRVNGQRSTVNGQWSKRRREEETKDERTAFLKPLYSISSERFSSVDFYLKNIYLKNIKREGGLLKQEIYLWKSLLRQLVGINGETFLARSAPRKNWERT